MIKYPPPLFRRKYFSNNKAMESTQREQQSADVPPSVYLAPLFVLIGPLIILILLLMVRIVNCISRRRNAKCKFFNFHETLKICTIVFFSALLNNQNIEGDLPPAYSEAVKVNREVQPPPYDPLNMWLTIFVTTKFSINYCISSSKSRLHGSFIRSNVLKASANADVIHFQFTSIQLIIIKVRTLKFFRKQTFISDAIFRWWVKCLKYSKQNLFDSDCMCGCQEWYIFLSNR